MTSAISSQDKSDIDYAKKGVWEIAGNANISYNNTSSKISTFSVLFALSPSYFILDHFHLGLAPGISYIYSKDSLSKKTFSFSVQPAVIAGYAYPIAKKIFLDLSIAYGMFFVVKSSNTIVPDKLHSFGFSPVLVFQRGYGLIKTGFSIGYGFYSDYSTYGASLNLGYSIFFD